MPDYVFTSQGKNWTVADSCMEFKNTSGHVVARVKPEFTYWMADIFLDVAGFQDAYMFPTQKEAIEWVDKRLTDEKWVDS